MRTRRTLLALLAVSALNCMADANSWLKPTSGNWEEPQWSQGILPNYGHSVMITNAGWKAVQIAPSTAQNFPDSLNVYSIIVASPVDSFNTLMVNYAGFDRPLTINYSLTIGSNAAMTMLSSALRLAGPGGVGLSIGGEFNQNDWSQVTGNQADVGWVGPGVYNLNSGLLELQHLFVGGPNSGVFNQNGGNSSPGILHLEIGGTYNLRDGDFNGTTYTADNTTFRQEGGRVHSLLEFHGGKYILNNGENYGGVRLGVYGAYRKGSASAVQNGGVFYGPISVGGEYEGSGSYVISNGTIRTPGISLGLFGGFRQLGGFVQSTNAISLTGGYFDRGGVGGSFFQLDSGFLASPGISVNSSGFAQYGGTNRVSGNLSLFGSLNHAHTDFTLAGGLLTTENTSVGGSEYGGFFQSGGTHSVANELSVWGLASYYYYQFGWKGYELSGGQLIVSNLSVNSGAAFRQTGGTILQSGTLKLQGGNLYVPNGAPQFGALQLIASNGLTMPSNSCVLRFKSSSALTWDSTAALIITNWSGSYLGGGAQRIIFGNSASALMPQQVARIFFRNPGGGLSPGLHPTRILATGEIVPNSVPPTGRIPPRLAIRKPDPYSAQITVTGEAGYDYGVLTTYDFKDWTFWTNRVATNGTMSVIDPYAWGYQKFYKAVLMR